MSSRTELYLSIEKTLEDLMPSYIQFNVKNKDILQIIVISEQFTNIPFIKRCEILSNLFELKANALTLNYTLLFFPYTSYEYLDKEINRKNKL